MMLQEEWSAFATEPFWKGGTGGSWSSLVGKGLKGALTFRNPSAFSLG